MKSSHAIALTAACVLALAFVWNSAVLTPFAKPPHEDDTHEAALVRTDPRPEEAVAEDEFGEVDQARNRQAVVPVYTGDVPAEVMPPTRLLARVVDRNGRPIAGARFDAPEWEGFGSAESDAVGRLELLTDRENIQIWQGRVVPRLFRVRADAHATRFLRAAMERDANTDLGDVVLDPGGVVFGRVVDERGAPIGGARVVMADAALGADADDARRGGPRGEDEHIEGATEVDGTFRLEGVAEGTGRAWAHVSGRLWAFTPTIDVAAGSETPAPDIVLVGPDPETLIAGVVLGPTGAPVAGAVVLASGLSHGPILYEHATADENGRFAVMSFDRGPHRIGAFHPEAALSPTYQSRIMPGTDDLELRLTELLRIEIQVVDDRDGIPVEEPWIRVEAVGGMEFAAGAPRADPERVGTGRIHVALPESKFTISASASGYDHRSVGPFTREAMPAVFEIRLERKPVMSGRVLADGEPVAGARVQTMRDLSTLLSIVTEGFQTRLFAGGAFATETDEEGRFEHPVSMSLPSGAHVVHASKEGWASTELVVQIDEDGASGLEIVLTRGGTIEGQVLLPAGSEPRGGNVAASNGDGRVRMTRPDDEGFYLLEHLAAGPWEVRFRQEQEQFSMTQSATPPDEPYQGDCVVFEGRTTRYDLRAQAVPIGGRLTIDGVPAARWTARLEDTQAVYSRDIAGSNVLDASGAFELVHDGRAALLVLETPGTTTEFVRLTREIPDGAVGTDASLEIETGRLTGTASAEARLRLTTTIAGVWHHQVVIEVGPDGSFAASVPAGRVTIAIETVEIGKFTRWVDATTADVVAGGAVAFELD